MKFSLAAALLAAMALTGCMGPAGNPNGQPYADQAGGALAVAPQDLGTASYDPNAKVAPFDDMLPGQPAINPPPPPQMPPSR
jgi:hypothetical protein